MQTNATGRLDSSCAAFGLRPILSLLVSFVLVGVTCGPVRALTIAEVTYRGGYDVVADPGGVPYTGPHWTSEKNRPYLHDDGTLLGATIRIDSPPCPDSYELEVQGVSGAGVVLAGNEYVAESDAPFPIWVDTLSLQPVPNGVAAHKPCIVSWQCRTRPNDQAPWSAWFNIGSASSTFYVCLAQPYFSAELWHSVVDLACQAVGATQKSQALEGAWTKFSSRVVKTVGGTPLKYYAFGTAFADNTIWSGELIYYGTGQCLAWAELWQRVIAVHRINSGIQHVYCAVPGEVGVLMKQWSPVGQSDLPPYPYLWASGWTPEVFPEMYPPPGAWLYGDLRNGEGKPGQNVPTPSEKNFGRHFIVWVDPAVSTLIYDPSYGVRGYTTNGYENSMVYAFGLPAEVHSYGELHYTTHRARLSTGSGGIAWASLPGIDGQ